MHDGVETEFKLRGPRPVAASAVDAALRGLGCVVSSGGSRHHRDLYLDDELGSLAAVGIGLRHRSDARDSVVTCKRRGSIDGGRFVREEQEERWSGQAPPRFAAELPAPLRHRIEPFVLDRPLQVRLELGVERELRMLHGDGRCLGEVAIDRATAQRGDRTATFGEVEVEVHEDLAGCEQVAAGLCARLGLQPADTDKPAHALALLGLPEQAPPLPPTDAGTPLGAAVVGRAIGHLRAARRAEVGLRLDQGTEPLHAMRVALRRLRGLVRAFPELWPAEAAQALLTGLGEHARRLGPLRDTDVLLGALAATLERLPGELQAGARRAVELGHARRAAELAAVTAWLGSPQRLADERRLETTLTSADAAPAGAGIPLATAVAASLARAARAVRRQARHLPDDLPLAPLHGLRLACKRLRYLAEEFASLPGLVPEKPLRHLVRLQQSLGEVCDHEVAAGHLSRWALQTLASEGSPDAALPVAAALGGLATLEQRAAGKARKAARRQLARAATKRPWRGFPDASGDDAKLA